MTIMLKAGGQLREMLRPDIDHYTRKVDCSESATMDTILAQIGIDKKYIAFIYVDGKVCDFSYLPKDGQIITLQPPVSGG
jgi:hypothetical protein